MLSNTMALSYEKPSFKKTALKSVITAHKTDVTASLEPQTEGKVKTNDL